jgi:hypothetical protein
MPAKFMIRDHPADVGASPSGATGWHQSDVVVVQTFGPTFPIDSEITNPLVSSTIRFSSSGAVNNYVKVRVSNIGDSPIDAGTATDIEKLDPASVQVRIFSPGRTQFAYPADYIVNENFPGLAGYNSANPRVIKPVSQNGTDLLVVTGGSYIILTFQITDAQRDAMESLGPGNRHFCMVAGILDGNIDSDTGAPNGVGLPGPTYLGNTWPYRKLAQRNLDLIIVP